MRTSVLLDKICTEKANWRIGRLGGRGDDFNIKSFDNPLAGAASPYSTPHLSDVQRNNGVTFAVQRGSRRGATLD